MYLLGLILLGITLAVGGWQLALGVGDIRDKNKKYEAARAYARQKGKLLLIAGGPWGNRRLRHLLNMPAHSNGDVCLDIQPNAITGHPSGVIATVTHIPFADKSFGAVFASHLLEHLPSAEEAKRAWAELNRVAEVVFIVSPSRQSLAGWLTPGHCLWVWQKDGTTYFQQRSWSASRQSRLNSRKEVLMPGYSPKTRDITDWSGMNSDLRAEASQLAEQLFGNKKRQRTNFTKRLLELYTQAQSKDFLLIHNPGGWGSTPLVHCLEWERSIVAGIRATVERLGYGSLLTQYFRSGNSWWSHLWDFKEQIRFFLQGKSNKAEEMVAELKFITRHLDNIRVILIGVSQGAAFSNTVMRQLDELHRIYSIELGLFFPHMSRRVITEHTLAVDSNGMWPDPMAQRNLWAGFKAYMLALPRWIKYWLQGKPRKFTACINVPGHEYRWEYPEVQRQIVNFLETNFRTKKEVEVSLS